MQRRLVFPSSFQQNKQYKIRYFRKYINLKKAQSTIKFEVLLSKWLAHSHNPSHDKQSFAPKANVLLFAERSQHFQVLQICVHTYSLPPYREVATRKSVALSREKKHPLVLSREKYRQQYLGNTPCKKCTVSPETLIKTGAAF